MKATENKQVLNESIKEGTVIHGTMRSADLIPAFLNELKETDDYIDFLEAIPSDAWEKSDEGGPVRMPDGVRKPDEHHEFWDSEDAIELVNDLIDAINNNIDEEGYYFGTTEGDGSDYGYWKFDDEDAFDESPLDEGVENTDKRIREDSDNKKFVLGIWPGAGYSLFMYGVEASCGQDALEKVVAYITKKNYKDLYLSTEEIDQMKEEDGVDLEDDDGSWEDKNGYIYVDATMDGADCPVYVRDENLKIVRVDEFDKEVEVIGEELDESKATIFAKVLKESHLQELKQGNWGIKRNNVLIDDDGYESKKDALEEIKKLKKKYPDSDFDLVSPDEFAEKKCNEYNTHGDVVVRG